MRAARVARAAGCRHRRRLLQVPFRRPCPQCTSCIDAGMCCAQRWAAARHTATAGRSTDLQALREQPARGLSSRLGLGFRVYRSGAMQTGETHRLQQLALDVLRQVAAAAASSFPLPGGARRHSRCRGARDGGRGRRCSGALTGEPAVQRPLRSRRRRILPERTVHVRQSD